MEYDTPRPKLCCRLGYYFFEKSQFSQAAFWCKIAIEALVLNNPWAIQKNISHTWLPHMQLGLCYYQMGEYGQDYQHNKIALSYKPDDKSIIRNMKLLEDMINK